MFTTRLQQKSVLCFFVIIMQTECISQPIISFIDGNLQTKYEILMKTEITILMVIFTFENDNLIDSQNHLIGRPLLLNPKLNLKDFRNRNN